MRHQKTFFILLFTLLFTTNIFASNEACFTSDQNCTQKLIREISDARQEILVQAYFFTSNQIARALVDAKNRGVNVQIILDKSQALDPNSEIAYFCNHGITPLIDYKPAIAHSKVMIFDNAVVATGSFNFTNSAQYKNSENLLIAHDPKLAQEYADNWHQRAAVSVSAKNYHASEDVAIFHERKYRRHRHHHKKHHFF